MEHGYQYFFTATILNWNRILNDDSNKQIIIDELRNQVESEHLKVFAFVIMPDHFHAIIAFPSEKKASGVLRDMFKWISKRLINEISAKQPENLKAFEVNAADYKFQIWERNSLGMPLNSQAVIDQKLQYIHNNPVSKKWNLAATPEEYLFSTAYYYYSGNKNWDFVTHIQD